jgi:hypothetical protein
MRTAALVLEVTDRKGQPAMRSGRNREPQLLRGYHRAGWPSLLVRCGAGGKYRSARYGAVSSGFTAWRAGGGRLARHAHDRAPKISPDCPWTGAFLTCWQQLRALAAPA